MKKRLVTTAILTLVISLSFFTVNATATTIETVNQRSNSYSVDGVVAKIYGFQLAPNNQGGSTISGSAYVPFYITMQVGNNNNYPVLLSRLGFTMDVTNGSGSHYTLYGIENYTDDLYLSGNQTNIFYVSPSAGFSNNGTGVIIPPKKCLYLVCEVQIAVDLQINGSTITWPTISWDSLNLRDFTVSDASNLTYEGEPVDFGSIEIFNDMLQALQGIDLDSSTYMPLINDILDNLTYNGSSPSNLSQTYQYNNVVQTVTDGLSVTARRIIGAPFYITSDYEYDTSNDSCVNIGTIRYPVTLMVTLNNSSSSNIASLAYHTIDNFFPNVGRSFVIDYFLSDLYYTLTTDNTSLDLYLSIKKDNNNYRGIIPSGRHVSIIQGHIDVAAGSTLTFGSINIDNFNSGNSYQIDNGYYPINSYSILRDLYIALNPDSATNDPDDVNTESQSINNAVENIQAAEAQYFADNQEAIENTGLSNFHFNDNQVWSLTMIVDQFEAVWNALGEFTVVYIFTLMMSLATYLIRHEPTTKVKQWRESVSAERAERTSYYGRKNAEARARDSTMKKAIRRR